MQGLLELIAVKQLQGAAEVVVLDGTDADFELYAVGGGRHLEDHVAADGEGIDAGDGDFAEVLDGGGGLRIGARFPYDLSRDRDLVLAAEQALPEVATGLVLDRLQDDANVAGVLEDLRGARSRRRW